MQAADPDVQWLLQFDDTFNPPADCGDQRCRDLFPEFIYIVIIPISIAGFLMNVILISLLVCCCVSRKKKTAAESEDQLACYDAVRRASIGIRRMSTSNSTPLLDDASRSGSMNLARNDHRRRGFRPRDSCHSAPGTLQRHHRNRDSASLQDTPPPPPAPPPYGAPQHHLMADEDEVFLHPEIPLQDLPLEGQNIDAAQNDLQQQDGHHHPHPHHHQHHRQQRPYSAANGYTTH